MRAVLRSRTRAAAGAAIALLAGMAAAGAMAVSGPIHAAYQLLYLTSGIPALGCL